MSFSKDRRIIVIIVAVVIGLGVIVLGLPDSNFLPQQNSESESEEKEIVEEERRPPEEFHVDAVSKSVYTPAMLNIQLGDTVTWTNIDSEVHTVSSANVTSDGGVYFHETLLPGETYSVTFDTPGTYFYSCMIKFHGMTGIVRVS
ncbi:MAG: plastocyanin/azurin family copper-binding protein [Nitrososphaerales archaeon]|nr:plastocyanin/azurin family copper-binding protein [Nitrososphaerales archaeon]